MLCHNQELGLAVVDLVKDPNPAGSLTRSTTLKLRCHKALETLALNSTKSVDQRAAKSNLTTSKPSLSVVPRELESFIAMRWYVDAGFGILSIHSRTDLEQV